MGWRASPPTEGKISGMNLARNENRGKIVTFLNVGRVNQIMDSNQVIETGVDKLVELLKRKGKLSFQESAKELGVSTEVIAEWADFLNEEGILGIEYKFTTPFLVDRKVSKSEIEKKAREFTDKKDLFVRKAEGTVNVLQKEAENMKKVQGEFDSLKKDLGLDLDSVKKELIELEKMEQMKEGLSKKLLDEKQESLEKAEEMRTMIARERKMYGQLLSDISREQKGLEKKKADALDLEKKGRTLRAEMTSIRSLADELEKRVKEDDFAVKHSEDHIERLRQMAEDIRQHIMKEKSALEPLLKKKEEHEKAIKDLQQEVLKKIGGKDGKRKASARLKGFFQEKMKVSMLVEKLNEDRGKLEKDLGELIKKAKAFQLTSKGKELDKEVKDIEGKFQEMEKRKGIFEEEFRKLGKLIRLK